MAYRRKSLRSMSPTTRKVARLIGELGSIERRLKNILPEIKNIEFESQALQNSKQAEDKQPAKASHGERLWALGEPARRNLKELNRSYRPEIPKAH